MMYMKIDETGLDLISRFEGFVNHPYPDIAGHLTIGFGHMIMPGEHFTKITREEALELLATDAEKAEHAVNSLVKVALDQNQFNALVSFVYNIGIDSLKHSTLLRLINDGNFAEAATEILKWDWAGGHEIVGLLNRRQIESVLLCKI